MNENRFYILSAASLVKLVDKMNQIVLLADSVIYLNHLDESWYAVIDRAELISDDFIEFVADSGPVSSA